MSYESQLRAALSESKDAKDASRTAGEGIWANYVRTTCFPNTPTNVEEFNAKHKQVVDNLDSIRELTKEEKNSLRSAKSVIGKAITSNVDVWKRDESAWIVIEDGNPMPKGKSELNETKSDYDRMVSFIEQAQKKYDSDTLEAFTVEQMSTLADMYAALAHRMVEDYQAARNN